jgi:hypothetical protein
MTWLINILDRAIWWFVSKLPEGLPPTTPSAFPDAPGPAPSPEVVLATTTPAVGPPGLLWDTLANVKHSVRVICDLEGLTLEQKNTLYATIAVESGFKLDAINHNRNGKGIIMSTDWGICQWNDFYHGKEISPEEAMHNPEKAVRLMCKYWKRGQRNLWIAYKSGAYKKYL